MTKLALLDDPVFGLREVVQLSKWGAFIAVDFGLGALGYVLPERVFYANETQFMYLMRYCASYVGQFLG